MYALVARRDRQRPNSAGADFGCLVLSSKIRRMQTIFTPASFHVIILSSSNVFSPEFQCQYVVMIAASREIRKPYSSSLQHSYMHVLSDNRILNGKISSGSVFM